MSEIKRAIISKLKFLETEHGVRVLWAVETGSRAWGFASPDSDYDVRFIYAHRPEWYLSIREGRDVIELPIEGVFDINGWDLRKALRLLRRSNPTFLEWVVSPFVYVNQGAFAELARDLAVRYYNPKAVAHHYTRMAEKNFRTYIAGRNKVILKKYLYVIRPLINVKWMMENEGLIPISLLETMDQVELPPPARRAIGRLIKRKSISPELGRGERIPAIDTFIKQSLLEAASFCREAPPRRMPLEELDGLFRTIIHEPR